MEAPGRAALDQGDERRHQRQDCVLQPPGLLAGRHYEGEIKRIIIELLTNPSPADLYSMEHAPNGQIGRCNNLVRIVEQAFSCLRIENV